MRSMIQYKFFLLMAFATVFVAPGFAQAPVANDRPLRPEFALDYSYLRSNAPPGGCGCFNLNGGSATFALPLKQGPLSVVVDVTAATAGTISSAGYSLTLSSYTVGLRYTPSTGHSRLVPFGQATIGAGHASGSLAQGQNPATKNASVAFAGSVGGGIDLRLTRRFSFRLIDADYLTTTFDNGGNNHQNNLHLSGGLVLHF